mmetsp:Transcript_786/g.1272  ORF Transcript_786/g.1272 Transcript_786/m.1272 type:complete len:239 (+) Transcript_786:543-1259(+)
MSSLSSKNLLPRVSSDIKLFPGHIHSETSRSSIAEGKPLTIICDPITSVWYANSRSGSIESKANIILWVGFGKIGELTVVSSEFVYSNSVTKLEVRNSISEPSLSERFPMANINIASSKHIPHGHFVSSSIGSRYNSNKVVIRDLKHFLSFGNCKCKTFLSNFGTMRTSMSLRIKVGHVISRVLLAWSRGELRIGGLYCRSAEHSHCSSECSRSSITTGDNPLGSEGSDRRREAHHDD